MRGITAKKLRKKARQISPEGSTKLQLPNGSIIWDGFIRVYRNLKKAWREQKWKL